MPAVPSRPAQRKTKKVVKLAVEAGDDATADLGIRRIQQHEKNAWMLESHLA